MFDHRTEPKTTACADRIVIKQGDHFLLKENLLRLARKRAVSYLSDEVNHANSDFFDALEEMLLTELQNSHLSEQYIFETASKLANERRFSDSPNISVEGKLQNAFLTAIKDVCSSMPSQTVSEICPIAAAQKACNEALRK